MCLWDWQIQEFWETQAPLKRHVEAPHPFLLFINCKGDRRRCLFCRYLSMDVLEYILKESLQRHDKLRSPLKAQSHGQPSGVQLLLPR